MNTFTFTEKEWATLFAALRWWQVTPRANTPNENDIATNGGEIDAMTVYEIDGLIDRMNFHDPVDLLVAAKLGRDCIAYCRANHPDAQHGEGFPAEALINAAIAKAEGRS